MYYNSGMCYAGQFIHAYKFVLVISYSLLDHSEIVLMPEIPF